jgi:hypothetical protein
MVIVLVSCALTIAVTRLFLVLTGYPQIGGSTFHLPTLSGADWRCSWRPPCRS